MKERARVIETDGEYAWVVLKKASSCGENCIACGLCEMDKMRKVRVRNTAGAAKGDEVEVTLGSTRALCLALITYALPLILFFLSALLWNRAWIALLTFLGSFFLCAFLANHLSKTRAFMSYITEKQS